MKFLKTLSLIVLALMIHSCKQVKTEEINNDQMNETLNTYLALGDSYTIGESVLEKDRFPVILAAKLNEKNYNFAIPKIIAKTGWTTDELKSAILKENISEKFDLVTLLIGVNNQYRGKSAEEFRGEFAELLQIAVNFSGGNSKNVIVVSIPDWAVSPFAENRDRAKISAEIDAFNTIKKEETLKQNITFVNITEISRMGLNKPAYFADDGLHFSGLMHRLWVDEIIKTHFK
jgi:lysophospholipase L1-like esterase